MVQVCDWSVGWLLDDNDQGLRKESTNSLSLRGLKRSYIYDIAY